MNAPDSQAQRIVELEQKLAALTEQYASAARELEAFTYAVSHDLRAPLRSLSGFSQALAESVDANDEKSRHYLDRIRDASRKMSELIDALLVLSRISRADLFLRDVDFTQLCNDAANALKAKYSDRDIAIAVQPNLHALGDQRLLRTAVEALLDNAIKFSSRQSRATIDIGRTAEGAFYIADHGAGFDLAYADKLFKPFQRLHAESDYPGIGIGLATVQRIVSRHNGRVWITGSPAAGATAFFTLSPAQGTPATT